MTTFLLVASLIMTALIIIMILLIIADYFMFKYSPPSPKAWDRSVIIGAIIYFTGLLVIAIAGANTIIVLYYFIQ
jgi:purine-cytosine permease-like protein